MLYDHLGLYAGAGFGHAALIMALVWLGLVSMAVFPPLVLVALLATLVSLIAIWSGLLAVSAEAWSSGNARWSHLRTGLGEWSRWKSTLLLLSIPALCAANAVAYMMMLRSPEFTSGVLKTLLTGMAILFAWLSPLSWCIGLILTADETDVSKTWKSRLLGAFRLVVLAPGLWLGVMLAGLGATAVAVASVMGCALVLPAWAVLGTVATHLARQHVTFLEEAAMNNPEATPAEWKRTAATRWDKWDFDQPRRTWKDLFRPWDA